MHRIDDHFTQCLLDEWDHFGPKRKRLLETSWAGVFRTYLFEELPIQEIHRYLHQTMGRPSKELYAMCGTLLLQQLYDYTDQQTIEAFAFSEMWHYALDITDTSDSSSYVCERTLRQYRAWMVESGADQILFRSLTDKLINVFQVDTGKQRLDSTHLLSDMRKMRRLDLLRSTIKKFLRELRRAHPQIFTKSIEEELREQYLPDKKNGCFSRVSPEEAQLRLQAVAEDLLRLAEQFRDHAHVRELESFKLLLRVLEEQCEVVEGETEKTVVLKDPQTISAASVQNPHDPEAGYDGHKGQGYQAQIQETYHEKTEDEKKAPQLDLIVYAEVESASASDGDALMPAIEDTQERGCAPQEVLADASYGSDENVEKAAAEGVDVTSPTKGKPQSKERMLILDDFVIDEESGNITQCPAGEAPQEIREGKKGKRTVCFDAEVCANCEYREYCCVGLDEKHTLSYTPKQGRLAQRRSNEDTAEFKEKYKYRSGIEATNSHLKRDLKMKRLRVRGLAKVRYVVLLKITGMNLMRAARFQKARLLPDFHFWMHPIAWYYRRVFPILSMSGNILTLPAS